MHVPLGGLVAVGKKGAKAAEVSEVMAMANACPYEASALDQACGAGAEADEASSGIAITSARFAAVGK